MLLGQLVRLSSGGLISGNSKLLVTRDVHSNHNYKLAHSQSQMSQRITNSALVRNSSSGQQEGSDVILETVNQKGIITLNRPKALNSLNLSMTRRIYPQLKAWESTQQFVIIKGNGQIRGILVFLFANRITY
jgi:hypothetical protein